MPAKRRRTLTGSAVNEAAKFVNKRPISALSDSADVVVVSPKRRHIQSASEGVNKPVNRVVCQRAELSAFDSNRAQMIREFSSMFWRSLMEYLENEHLLNNLIRKSMSIEVLIDFHTKERQGKMEDMLMFKTPHVPDKLRELFSNVSEIQKKLINEMFEFMKECAVLPKYKGDLIPNNGKLWELAVLQSSMTTAKLRAYTGMKFYLVLDDSASPKDPEAQRALHDYMVNGKLLQKDAKARKMIRAICDKIKPDEETSAVTALCAPRGEGKTQLSFSLPKDKYDVIYFNMGLKRGVPCEETQPIYRNFSQLMWFPFSKLQRDMDPEGDNRFWIYGLVDALLELIEAHPDLDLPGDLARLRVVVDPEESQLNPAKTFRIGPTGNDSALAHVYEFQVKRKRKLIFFLDEFTGKTEAQELEHGFVRRCLNSVTASVILASPDVENIVKHFAVNNESSHQLAEDNTIENLITINKSELPRRLRRNSIK